MLFGIDKWPNKDERERDKARANKDGRSNEPETGRINVETISYLR